MYSSSPLQTIYHPLFKKHNIRVQIKRDDLIHPIISGNKWRKLKYNLLHAQQHKFKGIISFGGAYSNHIHALAFACKANQLESIGIIRGEEFFQQNSTLSAAKHWGMQLLFVNRITYKLRDNTEYIANLQNQYPNYFIIPEGGSNKMALKGVGETIHELTQQTEFDTLITPTGSSGTLAGLIKADNNQHKILGVAVLKNAEYLKESVNALLACESSHYEKWQLLTNYHRGGYAKFSIADEHRILSFIEQTNIPFEPIYSGKMLLAFLDLVEQGYFTNNHRVVLLHTGGLQGVAGLSEQNKLALNGWPTPQDILTI